MAKYTPNTKEELQALIYNEAIHLGDIDTSEITDMSKLFFNSTRTDFSGIEKWNTSKVTTMEGMFWGCERFNQDLSSWDVSKVETMADMFTYCENFNQDISGWDVRNVKDMDSMFTYCSTFNQDISSWDTSNVENMKGMFKGCE
ncbi:DUF285 domain-containing protein, partial [Campylobacter jejuni]|nr:DUF285 domain-containing protein [Campylobacter jejuni]EGA8646728.1 DUF285 domain-containing protein [Campylobacter jejuni]